MEDITPGLVWPTGRPEHGGQVEPEDQEYLRDNRGLAAVVDAKHLVYVYLDRMGQKPSGGGHVQDGVVVAAGRWSDGHHGNRSVVQMTKEHQET